MFQKFVLTIIWVMIISISYVTWTSFTNKQTQPLHETAQQTEQVININIEQTDVTETAVQPNTYDEYINLANKFKDEEKYKTAIEYYQKALGVKENDNYTLTQLAETYFQNNQYDNALETYKKTKEIKPSTTVDINIVKCLLALNKIKEAKKLLWETDVSDLNVEYYQAIIFIIYNKLDDAENVFKTIINTSDDSNVKNLAQLKEKARKFINAYETFSYYIDEDNIHLKTLLAKAMSENEEYRPSIYILKQVIKEKADYRDAWVIMGFNYLNLEEIKESIDALTKAKKLDEHKPETLFYLGLAYFANNDIDKAIANIELADKNGYKQKDQIKLKLGDLYAIKGRFRDSEKVYDELLTINQNNIEIFTRSVWLNIDKLDDKEKALRIANKAIQVHPQNAMSYDLMGWVLLAENNYTQAEEYLNKALQLDPFLAAAHLNLGILYEKNHQNTLAKEFYQNAYLNGKNTSISSLAASQFNKLTEREAKSFMKANVLEGQEQ